MCAAYLSDDQPGIENGDACVSSEILDVEGQDAHGSMNHHRGDQTGVVAVLAGYAIGCNKLLPFTLQRRFGQQVEKPLEGSN